MTTWTADDIRQWQPPENRGRGTGVDPEKVQQFKQTIAGVVAEQEARINELQRQVHGPDNTRNVNHAVDLLAKAQETAEQAIRDADEYSKDVYTKARAYYEQLIGDANREAERIRQTISSGHGHIDARTADALHKQLAMTETLATILRGLVQTLETTGAELTQLHDQAVGSGAAGTRREANTQPSTEVDQFVSWAKAASVQRRG